jgi:glutathione S-transferase
VNRHWTLHLPQAEQDAMAERIAVNHARGLQALGVMERQLANADWLAAGCYTIADIALYAYTHTAREGGFDLEPYAGIRRWLDRVQDQPRHIPQMHAEAGVPVTTWPG